MPAFQEECLVLDTQLANAAKLASIEPIRVLDSHGPQPDLARAAAFADVHVRWLQTIAGEERETQTLDDE
jgi:hypothetical protein